MPRLGVRIVSSPLDVNTSVDEAPPRAAPIRPDYSNVEEAPFGSTHSTLSWSAPLPPPQLLPLHESQEHTISREDPALWHQAPPPPPHGLEHVSKDLQIFQEEVQDSREALIGSRFRLHTKRREVQTVRQQAGAETGAAYNLFKHYVLSQNASLPSHILEVIRKADEARDKLGIVETDYDDAEEKYNQEEWNYAQLEEEFVERLSGRMSAFPVPQHDETHAMETSFWTRFADAPVNNLNYSSLDEAVDLSLDHTRIVLEQETQRRDGSMHPGYSGSPGALRGAQSSQHELGSRHVQPLPLRPLSEADLDQTPLQWPNIRHRIDEWLLDGLKSSEFQQQRLRDTLSQHSLGDLDWFEIVRRWHLDSPHGSMFHTGDTTGPDTADEQSLADIAGPTPFHLHSQDNSETQLFTAVPDEAAGNAAPHLSITYESDHADMGTEAVLPATSAELLSDFVEQEPGPESPTHTFDGARIIEEDLSVQASSSDPTKTGSKSDMGNPLNDSQLPMDPVACPWSRTGKTDHARSESVPMARVDSAFLENLEKRPHTAPGTSNLHCHEDRSLSQKACLQQPFLQRSFSQPSASQQQSTSQPTSSQLFIEIPGPEPWALPLVRLTPVSQSVQRLDCIPFVSISDTPFSLPGPSKFLTSF